MYIHNYVHTYMDTGKCLNGEQTKHKHVLNSTYIYICAIIGILKLFSTLHSDTTLLHQLHQTCSLECSYIRLAALSVVTSDLWP